VADDDVIREVVDPSGSRVVLLGRLWREKVLRSHPELARHLDAVVDTVLSPDHVDADPVFEQRRRYYRRNAGPSRWLLVVVSYEQEPARIISAFGLRKDPRSWSA
jgi:hypothetical protein